MTWPLTNASLLTAVGVGTNTGTIVTAAGSANTKGSWAQLIASTAADADGFFLTLEFGPATTANTNTSALLDLGIGAAASEKVILSNLLIGHRNGATGSGPYVMSGFIPIPIPAGSRIAARMQSATASDVCAIRLHLVYGGTVVSTSQVATTYGVTAASSIGTALASGGSSGTKGSWTELTSSTTGPIRHLLVAFQGNSNSMTASIGKVDIGVGGSGSEKVLIPDIGLNVSNGENILAPYMVVPVSIPTGSRIVARTSSTLASVTHWQVAVYGIG